MPARASPTARGAAARRADPALARLRCRLYVFGLNLDPKAFPRGAVHPQAGEQADRDPRTRRAGAVVSSPAELSGGIPLFRVRGIRVQLDRSWFLIFFLVLASLAAGYFPRAAPGRGWPVYAVAGLLATLLFFASLLLHELAHSLVAIRSGIRIPSITLFLFGGVSQMEEEPRSPGEELRIALAGPLMSFALAGVFALLTTLMGGAQLAHAAFGYLAWINAAIGAFNLIPGFPLDGGRVLRAAVWWRTGSLERGTKIGSDLGVGFAVGLMVLGALEILSGSLVGGLWLVLIGMFMRSLARAGYQGMVLRHALGGVRVGDVMIRQPEVVSPGLSLEELVHDGFLRTGFRGFPVVENGRAVGIVSIVDVKDVPAAERASRTVREVMAPLSPRLCIGADEPLLKAVERLAASPMGRLLVLDGDRVAGLVSKAGLARFIEMRVLLDRAEAAATG
jgi:Zn-dependent protease/CBS domain-containing protein